MSELFPELDGLTDPSPTGTASAAAPAPHQPPAPGAPPSYEGLAFEGGDATIARFEVLFSAAGRLRSVRRNRKGEIEIVFDLGPAGLHEVWMSPAGGPPPLTARHFAFRCRDTVHPALERLLRHFVFRHAGVTFEEFQRQVVPLELDACELSWDDADSLVYSYGSVKGWRTFFEDREIYRGVCHKTGGNIVQVRHSELECDYNAVKRSAASPSFLRSLSPERTTVHETNHRLFTDLQDLDVIKGGDSRLDAALDSIASLPRAPALVIIESTCVPIVTGDDLEASADRARRKHRLPVVALGNHNNPQQVHLARLLGDRSALAAPRRPGTINLVGMPRTAGHDATLRLLAACGIEVNCSVLPDLDPDDVRRFGAADLVVLYPWERQIDAARPLLEHAGLPVITPPAPFGRARTRDWIMQIAGALGQQDRVAQAWDEQTARSEATWRDLTAAARPYRLGFVIPDERWGEALDGRHRLGVPLLDLVEEMGFGVDLLLYSGKPAGAFAPGQQGRRFATYRSREQLEALLRASDAVAFYSEIYFDPRLTRTGKNAFSIEEFQLGVEGAIATLRRLLAICRLPYFRTYARHLGSPFGPLAAGAPPRGAP